MEKGANQEGSVCKYGCGRLVSKKNKSCPSCWKVGRKRSRDSVNKQIVTRKKRYGDHQPGGFLKGHQPIQHFEKGHIPWNYNQDFLSGPNHHAWKDGITPIGQRIRNLRANKRWVEQILSHDNYTCKRCGTQDKVGVHHKKRFGIILKEFLAIHSDISDNESLLGLAALYTPFWDIDNGESICEPCHRGFHYETMDWLGHDSNGRFYGLDS